MSVIYCVYILTFVCFLNLGFNLVLCFKYLPMVDNRIETLNEKLNHSLINK